MYSADYKTNSKGILHRYDSPKASNFTNCVQITNRMLPQTRWRTICFKFVVQIQFLQETSRGANRYKTIKTKMISRPYNRKT